MVDWKKSIKKSGIAVGKVLAKQIGKFDRTAIIGLILLIAAFTLGLITRNSAYITNQSLRRLPSCDSYITWLCIPTVYIPIPLGVFGWLVINVTSALLTVVLFIFGVLLLRK